jgi:tetratricopeptide (TPR) repeat protein
MISPLAARLRRATIVSCLLALLSTAAAPASAQAPAQGDPPAREASRHFQRGVELYNEGDIRGALVEFKRAYVLLPRATVLYNIGQAEFQLQEYASALRTLERFLADTGPNVAHRDEVQQTVEILRGRVGTVALTSDHSGCEVTIDDQPAGLTPLAQPVLVAIGRRKVALQCAGSPRVTRDVEVAAGQTVRLDLKVGPTQAGLVSPAGQLAAPVPLPAAPRRPGARRGTAAWIVSGGLAIAAAGFYTAALLESRQLDELRSLYPITARALDDQARLTSALALVGDGFAAGALVAAGVASYLRWSGPARGSEITVGPSGVHLQGRF